MVNSEANEKIEDNEEKDLTAHEQRVDSIEKQIKEYEELKDKDYTSDNTMDYLINDQKRRLQEENEHEDELILKEKEDKEKETGKINYEHKDNSESN